MISATTGFVVSSSPVLYSIRCLYEMRVTSEDLPVPFISSQLTMIDILDVHGPPLCIYTCACHRRHYMWRDQASTKLTHQFRNRAIVNHELSISKFIDVRRAISYIMKPKQMISLGSIFFQRELSRVEK